MILLNYLTIFHNWLCDRDIIWWPFSFLRPLPHEPMTFKLTLLMTGCFGGFAFVMFTAFAIANNAFSASYAASIFFSCFGGFLVWFNLITKPLWNRRVKELAK